MSVSEEPSVQRQVLLDRERIKELFDLRPLSGDTTLFDAVRHEASMHLAEQRIAIALLANDTLANLPPLTFFQGLVIDFDGEQRSSVDLTKTAIAPIVDAARVFSLAQGRTSPCGTLERLRAAMQDFPSAAPIFADAAAALAIAQYYRELGGSADITPSQFGKYDQRLLKTAFSSIHRLLEFTTRTFVSAA